MERIPLGKTTFGLPRRTPPVPGQMAPPVIFLSLVFYPDSSATSMLFTDLFRRLAGPEAPIVVLCGFPTKDSREDARILPRREMLDGVQIIRCGLRIRGKSSLFARALSYSTYLLHAGVELLKMGRSATVLGGTDPPFTSVALCLLSLIGNFRYTCLILDLYPDGLVAVGKLRERSAIVRVWRALNRWSFVRADRILVIGRDMITHLERVYGVNPAKLKYIPHWGTVEVDTLHNQSRGILLQQLGLADKFVVQYSGNMGLWHDIESLVWAAHHLEDDRRIHFLFAGKGMRRAAAQRLANELGLGNITWLDFVPRDRLPEILVSCDVALLSMRAGLQGVAVPSKLYGILASGRPLVAQAPLESEVARTVLEEQCGIVIPPGDTAGLACAIRSLANNLPLTEEMGRRALNAYRTKYTLNHAIHAYGDILFGDGRR